MAGCRKWVWPGTGITGLKAALKCENMSQDEKQHHLQQLKDELVRLQYNLQDFDELVEDSTSQFKKIQDLAVMHGSLFMAGHTVFGEDNFLGVQLNE